MASLDLALVSCSDSLGVRLRNNCPGILRSERLPGGDKGFDAGVIGERSQDGDEVSPVQHRRRRSTDREPAGRLWADALKLCDELFELSESDVAGFGHAENRMDT
jgi:hypothetical protein